MRRRAFLLGPTASGKTAVALGLAQAAPLEILSMDSMLVYRGMDIGTAKPSKEERAAAPHHLIDMVEAHEVYSVARWKADAEAIESEVCQRGALPLYVGGTNLYFKALTSGLLQGAEVPAELRKQIAQERAEEGGIERLFAELQEKDPESSRRIHPNDAQRIVRAIEIYRATGRTLSSWQSEWAQPNELQEPAVALRWPREVLRERVARRYEQMHQEGFLDEIDRIQKSGGFGPTAGKALGYRQELAALRGEISAEQARERAITLTRTYIRRQMTWLRSFPELKWVEMCNNDGQPRPLVDVIAECRDHFAPVLSSLAEESNHDRS